MRRAVSSLTVAIGLLGVVIGSGGVASAAAPAPVEPTVAPGKKRCTVTDERLGEVSGLVATKTGYIMVNDGTDDESRKRIFYLDTACKVTKTVRYSGRGPLDTEDLALSPDGKTLWIGDIGDNITSSQRRERVAFWSMPANGSKEPVLHRVAYPEGKPHDAEALLVGDDGVPLVVTKSITGGTSEIFTPSAALKTNNEEPVPMKKVGTVTLPKTETPNVLGAPGRSAVTGAARSPDGARVVLRTYADAFEYDVAGGDIVKALTSGKPRVTPLADPFGESISYTPDGATFVTISDAGDFGPEDPIDVLAYTPTKAGAAAGAADPAKKASEKSWTDGLSLKDITYLIAAVGVIGAVLVGVGIFGIVRARRRPGSPDEDGAADARRGGRGRARGGQPALGSGPVDGPADDPRGRAPGDRDRRAAGVYGGGPARGGAVYGGAPPADGPDHPGRSQPPAGGVYGGAGRGSSGRGGASGGGVYGGARAGGGDGRPGAARPSGGRAGGGGVYGGAPGGGRERTGREAPREGRGSRSAARDGRDHRAEPPRDGRDYRAESPRDGRDYRAEPPRGGWDRGRDEPGRRSGRRDGRDYRDGPGYPQDRGYRDRPGHRGEPGHPDGGEHHDPRTGSDRRWGGQHSGGYDDEYGRHHRYGPRHDYRGTGYDPY